MSLFSQVQNRLMELKKHLGIISYEMDIVANVLRGPERNFLSNSKKIISGLMEDINFIVVSEDQDLNYLKTRLDSLYEGIEELIKNINTSSRELRNISNERTKITSAVANLNAWLEHIKRLVEVIDEEISKAA